MDQKEKTNAMYSDKYDHTLLKHFITDKDYCAQADNFIKKTLTETHPLPHEITCDCLFWKTRELPIAAIKGDTVDTTRAPWDPPSPNDPASPRPDRRSSGCPRGSAEGPSRC